MDNGYNHYIKFPRMTIKLINLLKKITDNGHHAQV